MDTKYQSQVKEMIKQLKEDDPTVKKLIERLEKSEHVVNITQISKEWRLAGGRNATFPTTQDLSEEQGSTIMFDPYSSETQFGTRHPRVGLVHEMGHADDFLQGRGILYDREKAKNGDPMELMNYMQSEEYPIWIENLVRHRLNLKPRTLNDYFDKWLKH